MKIECLIFCVQIVCGGGEGVSVTVCYDCNHDRFDQRLV